MKDATGKAIMDMACSEDCTTIVLGSQDEKVWVLNQEGEVLSIYPAVSWINGVGISRDGSVIAEGALNGNLYSWTITVNCWQQPELKVTSSNGQLR
jgi:WD40 repeat protein